MILLGFIWFIAVPIIISAATLAIGGSIAIAKRVKQKKYEEKVNAIQEEGELLNTQLASDYAEKQRELEQGLSEETAEDTKKIIIVGVVLTIAAIVIWYAVKKVK